MNRKFDGLTLNKIIEIQNQTYKNQKYYVKDNDIIREMELTGTFSDILYIDFINNCFIPTYFGQSFIILPFKEYKETWSDKREDLEHEI